MSGFIKFKAGRSILEDTDDPTRKELIPEPDEGECIVKHTPGKEIRFAWRSSGIHPTIFKDDLTLKPGDAEFKELPARDDGKRVFYLHDQSPKRMHEYYFFWLQESVNYDVVQTVNWMLNGGSDRPPTPDLESSLARMQRSLAKKVQVESRRLRPNMYPSRRLLEALNYEPLDAYFAAGLRWLCLCLHIVIISAEQNWRGAENPRNNDADRLQEHIIIPDNPAEANINDDTRPDSSPVSMRSSIEASIGQPNVNTVDVTVGRNDSETGNNNDAEHIQQRIVLRTGLTYGPEMIVVPYNANSENGNDNLYPNSYPADPMRPLEEVSTGQPSATDVMVVGNDDEGRNNNDTGRPFLNQEPKQGLSNPVDSSQIIGISSGANEVTDVGVINDGSGKPIENVQDATEFNGKLTSMEADKAAEVDVDMKTDNQMDMD